MANPARDFVIVGQGLAGTTLAWQLRRRGFRVLVLDREGGPSSSWIAAGLITPVTGKRLAKSWRLDEVFPAAVAFYRRVESETDSSFFVQRPSVRLFAHEAEREEFHRREGNVLAGLVRPNPVVNSDWFEAPLGGFEMPTAARLDVSRYLDLSREAFRKDDSYLSVEVDLTRDVEIVGDRVRLPRLELEVRAVVFSMGFQPVPDPWFGNVRFNAAKGEILTLRIPNLSEDRVIHRGVWLAPIGGDLFRTGSTYSWDDLTPTPTPGGRAEIEERLRQFLRLPFEVIDHRAAIRPVIDAGYPVLGRHPLHAQLAYFNGLGSKGSLLAPFFSDQLAANLADERETVEPVRRSTHGKGS